MDLKIIKKQDNPLLSRVEIDADADFFNEPTPKKEDIKKKIASMEKADEKLVVVKNIHDQFGSCKASVLVYIYKSEDELKKTEPKKKEDKKGAKPEEGADSDEGAKGETPATPKEDKKEAPKEESKDAKKE